MKEDIKNVITKAEKFIKEYGGGLPKDAILTKIHSTRLKNVRTGEKNIISYTLQYE